MGLGAVGGRGCVVEVVGRVERRQRWLGRKMRHEGQKEGRRRTMVGQLRWVWWGVAFQGWVVRAAHSWDVARGPVRERLCIRQSPLSLRNIS